MALIPIVDNPILNLDMTAFVTSDPAHARSFNAKDKQLLENDKSLKLMIDDALERINLLELMFSADVTGNPFIVTFHTIDDVIVEGSWNQAMARMEF